MLLCCTMLGAGPAAGAVPDRPGQQLWVSRYDADGRIARASGIGVSSDGARVFVIGTTNSAGSADDDWITAAYDGRTGTQLWVATYDGYGRSDGAAALAVSPDDATVYVTGGSTSAGDDPGFATIAYDAASGAQLWKAGFNGPAGLSDASVDIVASPDGSKVVVTGLSYLGQFRVDFATVAYEARTGHRQWVRFYDFGTTEIANQPAAMAIDPSGDTVYVTGESYVLAQDAYDYATVAYATRDGATRWVARYDGPAGDDDLPRAITASADGSAVFVTGSSIGTTGGYDYATVGYDAATGSERWVERWDGPTHDVDVATGIVVDPGGAAVFVTGATFGTSGSDDYGTVAYDQTTGAQLWGTRFAGAVEGRDDAYAIAVSPGGTKVYVTGETDTGIADGYAYGTIAYDAVVGRQLWIRRYNGPAHANDNGAAIAAGPLGSRVFVTGDSQGQDQNEDLATVAYSVT